MPEFVHQGADFAQLDDVKIFAHYRSDVKGQVTRALEIVHDPQDGHDEPQITRHRLLLGQHRHGTSLHVDKQIVDLIVAVLHLLRCLLYTSDAADDLLCVDL